MFVKTNIDNENNIFKIAEMFAFRNQPHSGVSLRMPVRKMRIGNAGMVGSVAEILAPGIYGMYFA